MRYFNYILALLVIASLTVSSCDVLNEEVVSGVTADQHYATPEGFEDAVRASYMYLRNYYADEQGVNMSVFGTDEFTHGGHGGFTYMNQYAAGLNSEAAPIQSIWNNFYLGINAANAALNRSNDVDIPEQQLNIRRGEARFMRAHYYFILVQFYGPLHLTLEETEGVEIEARRDPEDEIYRAIVEDLEFGIEHLPAVQDDYGRATRPAAKHMLSQVLLTRAQHPGNFAEPDDLSRAADLAQSVINDYDFMLLDEYADVFDHNNERNEEIIWSVQYTEDPLLNYFPGTNVGGNRSHMYYRPWYEFYNPAVVRTNEPGYGRPWIRMRPTQWGLENFRPLDVDARYEQIFQDVWYYNSPREPEWPVLPEGANPGDTAIWVHHEDLSTEEINEIEERIPGIVFFTWYNRPINMFPSIMKYDDFKRPGVNYEAGSRDYFVYRLAETHLLAAEAHHLLGQDGEAANHLNVVRRRAAHPGMESEIEISAGEVDIDFILDERARELFGEQKRWLDLKRTGRLLDRVRAYNPQAAGNIQEHHLLRPIPAGQITRTFNDYPQNPGY